MVVESAPPGLDPDQERRLRTALWCQEGGLDAPTREWLLHSLRDARIKAGTTLWHPGEELRDEMVLLSGSVRLFLVDSKGREWNTHLLCGPCFFPPLHLRTRGGRAVQRAETRSACELQRLDAAAFCVLRERTTAIFRLGNRLVEEELERLRRREESLLGLDLPERIALLLRDRPEVFQAFLRRDIASYLHATPEALSRALAGRKVFSK